MMGGLSSKTGSITFHTIIDKGYKVKPPLGFYICYDTLIYYNESTTNYLILLYGMFNEIIKFRCENINKEILPLCNDDWDYCEKKYIIHLITLYFLQYRNRHTRMNSQGNKFIIH